jgi:hypothetical protein
MPSNTSGFPDCGTSEQLVVTQFFEAILAKVRRGKGVDEWMDEVRSMPDSFYAATKSAKGIDAAEAKLDEVVKRLKYREITASLSNIIAGVAELAKVEMDAPLVELLSRAPSRALAQMLGGFWNASPKFLVVSNLIENFSQYNALRNTDVWSPDGTLGLQAIIVRACVQEQCVEDISVSLMLVPPVRFGPL